MTGAVQISSARPIQTTFPGRDLGYPKWTDEDVDGVREGVVDREIWAAYLEAENELGYLPNGLFRKIERIVLETVDRRWAWSLITEFRYSSFRQFAFKLWQPAKQAERHAHFLEWIETSPSNDRPLGHGEVEWSVEETDSLFQYIETQSPDFASEYLRRMDEVGFVGFEFSLRVLEFAEQVFPHPSDLSITSASGALRERLIETRNFRMHQAQNQELLKAWERDYAHESSNNDVTFDDWLAARLL